MRRLISLALVSLFAALVATSAFAKEATLWKNPGHHPLSNDREQVMNAREGHLAKAGLAGEDLKKVVAAMSVHGDMKDLVDGECFDKQVFEAGRVVNLICVAFGDKNVNRTAERWRVTLASGDVVEVTLPYVCHNLSIRIIHPKPAPPRTPCARINFDYSANRQVVMRTPGGDASAWKASADQAFMFPDTPFAFVLVHVDVTDAELADLKSDECFGYGDETGFHREVVHCEEFCVNGSYPDANILAVLTRQKGIRLPAEEPQGSFRIPLANGRGYLSLPLRYADRFVLPCVEVEKYHLSLEGYERWTSNFDFDIVTSEEGRRSLKTKAAVGEDLNLLGDNGRVRYLNGALQF